MKGKKIIIISILVNILLTGIIYNLIKKDYLNNEKIIVKAMTEGEYENYITTLHQSHEDYAKYIQTCKEQIARAITDMGVETSQDENLEKMADNIRNINSSALELLWTNPNPTSNFSAQTVELDLSEYTYVGITCRASTSVPGKRSELIFLANKGYVIELVGWDSSINSYRHATASEEGVTFTVVTGANYCIPTHIYGIK